MNAAFCRTMKHYCSTKLCVLLNLKFNFKKFFRASFIERSRRMVSEQNCGFSSYWVEGKVSSYFFLRPEGYRNVWEITPPPPLRRTENGPSHLADFTVFGAGLWVEGQFELTCGRRRTFCELDTITLRVSSGLPVNRKSVLTLGSVDLPWIWGWSTLDDGRNLSLGKIKCWPRTYGIPPEECFIFPHLFWNVPKK